MKRAGRIYQTVAVLVLNTLLLMGGLEAGAALIVRGQRQPAPQTPPFELVPYYATESWTPTYQREAAEVAAHLVYTPYTLWRRAPYNGQTISIGADGLRHTPGAQCDQADALRVFIFGGSTVWGVGAPDWGTIPAYVQERLDDTHPVCVVNYGESGYVSTQGVIRLLGELQAGHVPDVVIFYEGANDPSAAYLTWTPGAHRYLNTYAERFHSDPLSRLVRQTALYQLWQGLETPLLAGSEALPGTVQIDDAALALQVREVVRANVRAVRALGEEYGFASFWFWQPVLPTTGKTLTANERAWLATIEGGIADFHRRVAELMRGETAVIRLVDVFDQQRAQIFFDGVHVTPDGNALIAEAIVQAVNE